MEPWQTKLRAGDAQGAWDLFHERYRRLILATIRRLISDHDDVMDVYATLCQTLAANDCARLQRYSERASGRAGAGTWVVAVVRNFTVDQLRAQHGRERRSIPSGLSDLHQEIYRALCLEGHSYVEAYELIRQRGRGGAPMTFSTFLRESRATDLQAPCPDRPHPGQQTSPLTDEIAIPTDDPAVLAETAGRLGRALGQLPADVRLAVDLFVVEGLPAADVARAVGWPNAKAVYNRVARALAGLREVLRREGVQPGDV